MTARSKIVGLTRHIAEPVETEAETVVFADTEVAEMDEFSLSDDNVLPEQTWDVVYDAPTGRRWMSYVVPSLLLLTFLGWTGFFISTYLWEIAGGIDNSRIIDLIGTWALPSLLIGVAWLLMMRNSRAETDRFGDAAYLLRNESEALELRMRTVNEEITMAREFLAQNSRELESVGRQAASKLTEAAEQLTVALADSDEKAKTLERVSNAATTNLELLRKHLPVVTSAARDATNQIGTTGNHAQEQIKDLIQSLGQMTAAGELAKESIHAVEVRTLAATEKLGQTIDESVQRLNQSTDAAETRTSEMSSALIEAAIDASKTITQTGAAIDQQIAISGQQLEAQIGSLETSLGRLSQQSSDEDLRISAILQRISTHIDDSATRISAVDETATDNAAKLAFVVSALNDSTQALGGSLRDNGDKAEILIERSERLLTALESANREISETLPASIGQTDTLFANSMAQLDSMKEIATALDDHGNELLTKLTSLEHLIDVQRNGVEKLIGETTTHFSERHEQVDALASALTQTRDLIEQMTETANDRLVGALLRVRETTRQAAENSKQILDEELSSVADRLSEQNKELLSNAVEDQIGALGKLVQQSIERNITLSEAATEKMSVQLRQIDEMSSNLEKRIIDTKSGFESISDDSFARQMVVLTESLNSTAIDVAKILSNDVTDTSWAAYLKGDRGVFTRRAVRLLDAGEARAIAAHYGGDSEFSEHVNRYIHDFEAMMRVLLSTRDGNAIGVTLLSSDVGKLYVALAQAIERLRK